MKDSFAHIRIDKKIAVVRFAGDSGDGIQVIGAQMTDTSAAFGNDVHTFPDYPAEIRAPAGTVAGVSGYQLCFSSEHVHTPGDQLDTLIALNPAALKADIGDLKPQGILIIDSDKFTKRDLSKAGYNDNPLQTGELDNYRVVQVPISTLTLNAVEKFELTHSKARRCKNMFALGIVYWLYERSLARTLAWIKNKYKDEAVARANQATLQAGYNYALTVELFSDIYQVLPAKLERGTYRYVTGNQAIAYACLAAAEKSKTSMLVSGYPITPASDILHELVKYTDCNITTLQLEDEVAAACAAIGAAYGGKLAMTCTSGPGFDLKAEAIGLAIMVELPLVVIDVQRAGPSTGMPTKSEQADLLTAIWGRHGEAPAVVLAPATPSDCFNIVYEAFQIATKYMTPVIVLSDANLASAAEPWRFPLVQKLADIVCKNNNAGKEPYARDNETLARPWIVPGDPGQAYRIGGLEKDLTTGHISYDPKNHAAMVKLRAEKVERVINFYPATKVEGDKNSETLVLSWGSTCGVIQATIENLIQTETPCAWVHLRYLNPLPQDLGDIISYYKQIIVVEYNLGQLSCLIQAKYAISVTSITKVQGKPFLISELKTRLLCYLQEAKV